MCPIGFQFKAKCVKGVALIESGKWSTVSVSSDGSPVRVLSENRTPISLGLPKMSRVTYVRASPLPTVTGTPHSVLEGNVKPSYASAPVMRRAPAAYNLFLIVKSP
jgi:hypothetical protein